MDHATIDHGLTMQEASCPVHTYLNRATIIQTFRKEWGYVLFQYSSNNKTVHLNKKIL